MKEKVKKKNDPVIKTKRLLIQPMTDEEIRELCKTASSEDLRTAYKGMLSGCEEDPQNRIWYAPWKMSLKKEGTYIGDLGFKGPVREHAVEIGYGILKEYEGNGYMTEAAKALMEWALGMEGVVFIEAETAPDNKASQRILEKLGFVPDGEGEEGPRFVAENPLTNWMSIYMLFGISIGTSFGMTFGNIGIGLSLGLCLGLCIGAGLDSSAKKEREKIRRQREMKKKAETD